MSEEEKKAIRELKHYINMTPYWRKQEEYTNIEIDNYIKKVLNLIENQQKEIEELNKLHYDLGKNFIDLDSKCKQQQKEIERLNGIINSRYYHDLKCRELEKEINENWKDKIRELREIDNIDLIHFKIKELLEEE